MASKNDSSSRRHVVLDGPLIVYGGAGGESPDGRRLASAFEWYEGLDYTVEATISNKKFREFVEGTFYAREGESWVKKKKKPVDGAQTLKRLMADGKLSKYRGDDDKVMLDKCIKKDKKAWIVTHDKFDDRVNSDGTITKRQRSKYPHLPWDEIDKFTRGTMNYDGRIESRKHWYVDGKDFFDHEMPKAPPKLLHGKFSGIRKLANDLTTLLTTMDGELEELGESKTDNKSSMRTRIKKMQFQASNFIDLIPNEELVEEDVSALTVQNLRILAKQRGLSGYSKMKKADLILLIMENKPAIKKISGLTLDDGGLDDSTEKIVRERTKNIDHIAFFENLFLQMKRPDQWTVFTTPYAHMVKEKPEFHLKSMGVNAIDFLKLHPDKVEISQRKGHPWIRKK